MSEFISSMFQNIVSIAALLAAVLVICNFISLISKGRHSFRKWFFKPIIVRMDGLEMRKLKTMVCDTNLPLAERLKAGDEYERRGGNGEIHVVLDVLREEYSSSLKKNNGVHN